MTVATAFQHGEGRAVSYVDTASFQRVRPRLFGIAYRVVGNPCDADDVVQDTWIRWQTTDRSTVRDAAAFLATTTMRLAINLTQSARARRVTAIGSSHPEMVDHEGDPAGPAERSEEVERAVLVLLERLTPNERAAYVLREAFGYSYRDVGTVLALSEENARQLVRRARKDLSGERRSPVSADGHRRLLRAFLAAARTGDLAPLEDLLAADAATHAGLGVRVLPGRACIRRVRANPMRA